MSLQLLDGERAFVTAIVENLADDTTKLVYADWLEERGDKRAQFLRSFVEASRLMTPAVFPKTQGFSEEWLELIGFRILERIATAGEAVLELRDRVLRLARPALRMVKEPIDDEEIAVGASKIGGLPDLPPGFAWPDGGACHAIYNSDTRGTKRLAGFLAQVNIAEVATSMAAKDLPSAGLLSFFCFQDIENDDPDSIGAKAIFFPDAQDLVRKEPPEELTDGNTEIEPCQLTFHETLDLPEVYSGPWSRDLNPGTDAHSDFEALDYFRTLNFENMLGYGRATTGDDPTPSKESRHLIVLRNAVECMLHIQISQKDLAARNFDKITLNWVDFD
jgi:uncharacterized protein (TIGR02996 family)